MRKTSGISRRNFLKGMGIAVAVPVVAHANIAKGAATIFAPAAAHKILTANIRVALPEDEPTGNGWKSRRALCAAVMKRQQADIICMQEVLREQNEDLKKALPGFISFGFEGPEMDMYKEGYHGIAKNPIFFSGKRYELTGGGSFWLSETPLVAGSLSWDTARARNAVWVRLKDRKSGKEFRVVNLHLDHKGQQAREKQTEVVLSEAAQYQKDFPQILTGDFNAGASNAVFKLIKDAQWQDTYQAVHGTDETGFTAHGFFLSPKEEKGKKIDFIFTKGNFEVKGAEIIKDHEGKLYPSDHYFVSAVVRF